MPGKKRRISRRDFLTTGASALAGGAALSSLVRAQSPGSPQTGADSAPVGPTVPDMPSIPEPIQPDEYAARQAAARKAMGDFIDAVILPPGPSMLYLTGVSLSRRDRIVGFIIFRGGGSLLLCSSHEQEAAQAAPVPIDRIVVWKEADVPETTLRKILRDVGLTDKRIALGPTLWYNDMASLSSASPDLQFISASAVIDPLKESKSEAERALIRAASRIAERAIVLSWSDAKQGVTERALADRITGHCAGMGVEATSRALFGERTADRHAASGDRPLAAGDSLVLDCAVRVHGYWGRVARSAVLGKPSGRMTMIQSLIVDARARALEAAKPDLAGSAVFQRARGSLGSRGLGRYVPERLGQGIGLELEEPPWISEAGATRLAVGNVFTFEPGLDTPGEYGLRSVDVLEISLAGGRFLTDPPASLLEL